MPANIPKFKETIQLPKTLSNRQELIIINKAFVSVSVYDIPFGKRFKLVLLSSLIQYMQFMYCTGRAKKNAPRTYLNYGRAVVNEKMLLIVYCFLNKYQSEVNSILYI